MNKRLLFLRLGIVSLFPGLAVSNTCNAQTEDSCVAFMLVQPDHNDPMTVHFAFNGVVPAGSFQFLGQWDFGDGGYSTDSLPVHTYAQPGTYLVCLSFSICIGGGISCSDDTCQYVTVGTMAGIESTDGMLHRFFTYPNPVKSEFYVRSDAERELQIKVSDAEGRTVLNARVKNDATVKAYTLSNGIYFIEATDGSNVLKRKMIVQK